MSCCASPQPEWSLPAVAAQAAQLASDAAEEWGPCISIAVLGAGMLPCLKDGAAVGKKEKLYSLTGTTGSLMYMAPEVGLLTPVICMPCLICKTRNMIQTDTEPLDC